MRCSPPVAGRPRPAGMMEGLWYLGPTRRELVRPPRPYLHARGSPFNNLRDPFSYLSSNTMAEEADG